jgi:hypothetical protein
VVAKLSWDTWRRGVDDLLDVCPFSEKKAQLTFSMLALQWRKAVRSSGKRAGQTDRKSVVGQTLKVYGSFEPTPKRRINASLYRDKGYLQDEKSAGS